MADAGLYTIGEVAAMLGVSTHTIRAWERRHALVQPVRTRAGQRRYRREDVDLLRDVRMAVNVSGLSLKLASETVHGSQALDAHAARRVAGPAERLPESSLQNMWRGVADVSPHLIFLLDTNGRIIESNIAAAKTFGVVLQRLNGRLFADLVEPFDRAKAVMIYTPQSRTVKDWELNVSTASGARLYSFQSWVARRGSGSSLLLMGSEMFAGSPSPPGRSSNENAQGSQNGLDPERFQRVLEAASVIRRSPGRTGLGAIFLERLARLVEADSASIGRLAGADFVVEASYAPGGSLSKRGDRFPLIRFASSSIRTGQPTMAHGMGDRLPEPIRTAYRQTKHILVVPLVFLGRTTHLICLTRFVDRAFDNKDVEIVQALSGTALLSLELAGVHDVRPRRSAVGRFQARRGPTKA
jgi:PAS domain S-box-containing protein